MVTGNNLIGGTFKYTKGCGCLDLVQQGIDSFGSSAEVSSQAVLKVTNVFVMFLHGYIMVTSCRTCQLNPAPTGNLHAGLPREMELLIATLILLGSIMATQAGE